jgi:hypothetical protein
MASCAQIEYEKAQEQFGLSVSMIRRSANSRIIEMFISWEEIFGNTDTVNLDPGKKIAFTITYKRVDELNPKCSMLLSLKNRCDPYCNSDNWGDIELGPPLSEATAGCDTNSAALPFKGPPFNKSIPTKMQRFSILGQRLHAENNPHRSGVLISRTIGKSGAAWVKKVLFGR